jgi:RNA polymerase sigma factor (sigma-70 family)
MMMTRAVSAEAFNDAELVGESLAGNRDAFGQIITRYQSLVCSLAYSATGSLSQSEDLAQETFVAAWQQLADLREPQKLRSWLCGIVRNLIGKTLRRQGREPSHAAEPLTAADESPAPGPLPSEHLISREEEAILWRSIERIPETYREPLVLFYREHQSIESVAQNLELSEDAVKQRLSRGRKLLHEQVLAFVEGALERTNPSKAFTLGVLAALPAFSLSAKAAVFGATAAKGSSAAKAAAATGLLSALSGPLLVLFGNYTFYRMGLDQAQSDEERGHVKSYYRKIGFFALGLFLVFAALAFWVCRGQGDHSLLFTLLINGLVAIYLVTTCAFAISSHQRRRQYLFGLLAAECAGRFPKPAWEYRSPASLFGLPFVHICIGDRFDALKKPVTAWIAVGSHAVGGIFAFGSLAIAPCSVGLCAVGLGVWRPGRRLAGLWLLRHGLECCGGRCCARAWFCAWRHRPRRPGQQRHCLAVHQAEPVFRLVTNPFPLLRLGEFDLGGSPGCSVAGHRPQTPRSGTPQCVVFNLTKGKYEINRHHHSRSLSCRRRRCDALFWASCVQPGD